MIEVNLADVIDEVIAASDLYESALAAGDVGGLNALFWHDERTVRLGDSDVQRGHDEISAYRRDVGNKAVIRVNDSRNVIAFGRDMAVVDVLSTYPRDSRQGRQSQIWLRTDQGWRVAHAHVSRATDPAIVGRGER